MKNQSSTYSHRSLPLSKTPLGLGAAVLLLAAACGSEASFEGPQGEVDAIGEGAVEEPAVAGNDVNALGAVVEIPGFQRENYPEAPYGFTVGTTIQNLDFLGWLDPAAEDFELSSVSQVQLSDFYNSGPAGEGVELLMVNAVAVWCGACRVEYDHFDEDQIYTQFQSRGLEMLGVLFEDNNRAPATYSDLVNWASTFDVPFPFVLDPGFKTGAFFDGAATPMNMIIDTRTMRIVESFVGFNPQIFDVIDAELTRRGR